MTSSSTRIVDLIGSIAEILGSSNLDDCLMANNDTACTGGVVAVEAYRRNLTGSSTNSSSSMQSASIITQRLDRYSAFVQMHPLGWTINRVAFHQIFGYKFFTSTHAVLYLDQGQDAPNARQDLSGLQTEDFPMLLTNAFVPPSNSWYAFTKAIYFDDATGLAVLSVADSNVPMSVSQELAAIGMLDYIHELNFEAGCVTEDNNSSNSSSSSNSQKQQRRSNLDLYLASYTNVGPPNNVTNVEIDSGGNTNSNSNNKQCWIPVVWYGDSQDQYNAFIGNITNYRHPPALIIDTNGNDPRYLEAPGLVKSNSSDNSKNIWLFSYTASDVVYSQFRLTVSNEWGNGNNTYDSNPISNIEYISRNLTDVPSELKDELYYEQFNAVSRLANEASLNNPIVGTSTAMPGARVGNYRRCIAGECEIGDLFTDALRWKAGNDTDVAFITSGGLRGLGWPAGPVHLSDLWQALPFPNTLCKGVMNGLSLYRLFNYSTSVATFQGTDNSDNGNLLQVSGARVTYNTELTQSRLVKLEVWSKESFDYEEVEYGKLYKFASDNYLCESNYPYPILLGKDLDNPGEVMGKVFDDSHQAIVADYLEQLDGPYIAKIKGRLINNTSILTPVDFSKSEKDCGPNTYWDAQNYSCAPCPKYTLVIFSDRTLEFDGVSGSLEPILGNVTLFNNEGYGIFLSLQSIPPWIQIMNTTSNTVRDQTISMDRSVYLPTNEQLSMEFVVNTTNLEAGTAQGAVSLSVSNGVKFPRCKSVDVSFDVFTRVTPPPNFNQIGPIRNVGWTLTFLACFTAVFFALWVRNHRDKRIVSAMQPIFLITVCVGVFIMALAIIPISIDDGIASVRGCDIACMSIPWLISLGFSVTFSALFSKLWRINRLFHVSNNFRRVKVNEQDVLAPFAVVFLLNLIVLVSWTVVDPLKWHRKAAKGEPWNTYGVCRANGHAGIAFISLTIIINVVALACACYQAYKARNISDDFSESKNVALAVFSWVQLSIVGFPVLFLIYNDNQDAKYYLIIFLIFAACMSMLLFIFIPMMIQVREFLNHSNQSQRRLIVGMSKNQSMSINSKVNDPRISQLSNNFQTSINEQAGSRYPRNLEDSYDSNNNNEHDLDNRESVLPETRGSPSNDIEPKGILKTPSFTSDENLQENRRAHFADSSNTTTCTSSASPITTDLPDSDRTIVTKNTAPQNDNEVIVDGMTSLQESTSSSNEVSPEENV